MKKLLLSLLLLLGVLFSLKAQTARDSINTLGTRIRISGPYIAPVVIVKTDIQKTNYNNQNHQLFLYYYAKLAPPTSYMIVLDSVAFPKRTTMYGLKFTVDSLLSK